VFMDAHRAGLADGLFLTSGVPGRPAKMTDRMLAAVDLLRRREDFQGYVHLKLLPGAEPAQVETAVRLASRVSINLEAPGATYVRALAREKDFAGDLLPNLELAGRLMLERRREKAPSRFAAVGTTTQFVVGAAGEQDREILDIVTRLERRRLLHHAHFRATALPGRASRPAVRLRLRRAGLRRRRQPAARRRSEDGVGARASRALSGRGLPRAVREPGACARDRPGHRPRARRWKAPLGDPLVG